MEGKTIFFRYKPGVSGYLVLRPLYRPKYLTNLSLLEYFKIQDDLNLLAILDVQTELKLRFNGESNIHVALYNFSVYD